MSYGHISIHTESKGTDSVYKGALTTSLLCISHMKLFRQGSIEFNNMLLFDKNPNLFE